MMRWQPYSLGVWITRYIKKNCQICHSFPSKVHNHSRCNSKHNYFCKIFSSFLDTGILCENCYNSIVWLPESSYIHFNNYTLSIQPATYYDPPISQIIRNFKFNEDMNMLPILVHIIEELPYPQGWTDQNSVIVAMPTTNNRIRDRGFDPLTILTHYLSINWQIPIWKGVSRIDDTVSQRGLSRHERFKNLKGAFHINLELPVDNIILFDDVSTTGASLQELANIFLSTYKSVHLRAYCLAHGSSLF